MGTAVGMREELQKRAMAKSHAQHHPIFGRKDICGRVSTQFRGKKKAFPNSMSRRTDSTFRITDKRIVLLC